MSLSGNRSERAHASFLPARVGAILPSLRPFSMLSFRRALARRLLLPSLDIAALRVLSGLRPGLIQTMLVVLLPPSPLLATSGRWSPSKERSRSCALTFSGASLVPQEAWAGLPDMGRFASRRQDPELFLPTAPVCSIPAQGRGRPAMSRWAVGTSGRFSWEGRKTETRKVEVRSDSYHVSTSGNRGERASPSSSVRPARSDLTVAPGLFHFALPVESFRSHTAHGLVAACYQRSQASVRNTVQPISLILVPLLRGLRRIFASLPTGP
jgi:hypothetical protein